MVVARIRKSTHDSTKKGLAAERSHHESASRSHENVGGIATTMEDVLRENELLSSIEDQIRAEGSLVEGPADNPLFGQVLKDDKVFKSTLLHSKQRSVLPAPPVQSGASKTLPPPPPAVQGGGEQKKSISQMAAIFTQSDDAPKAPGVRPSPRVQETGVTNSTIAPPSAGVPPTAFGGQRTLPSGGPQLAGGGYGNTFLPGMDRVEGLEELDDDVHEDDLDEAPADDYFEVHEEEAKLRLRLKEQVAIIKKQDMMIQEKQIDVHTIEAEKVHVDQPSEIALRGLLAKVQGLEAKRYELKKEIHEMEQELSQVTIGIEYQRKEMPKGQPKDALVRSDVRSSYEHEAKAQELAQKTLVKDIVRLKQLCIAHDEQMRRQDTQTARLNVHLAQLKQEFNLHIGAYKEQAELLDNEIGNIDKDIETKRSQLASTRRLEARAYQNAIAQERGAMLLGSADKQRDSETYQKYWEALEHVQKLKADIAKAKLQIEMKESYTQSTLMSLKTAGMQDGSLLPGLLSRERDMDDLRPVLQDISYA